MAGDGYFSSRYFPNGYFGNFFGGSGSGSSTLSGTSAGLATALGVASGVGTLQGSAAGLASVTGALTASVSPAALTAFQPNAFQVDAFQIAVEVMATAIAYQESTRPAKGAKARRKRRKDEESEDEVEDEIAKARREGRLRKIMPNDFDGGSDRPIFVSEEAHAEAQAKEKRRKARAAKKAVEAKPEAAPVPASSDLIQRLGALSVSDASAALIAAICKVSDMEKAAHLRALEAEAAEDDDMEALLLMMEF